MESPSGHDSPGYASRDRKTSLSESLVGGTSKFFSSVVAKKNGLISDLSNKIETTFSPRKDRTDGGGANSEQDGSAGSPNQHVRTSSTTDSPPPSSPHSTGHPTPPPRPPPPPRRQPSFEAVQQARSSMKRMTSVPAYQSSGPRDQHRRNSQERQGSRDKPRYSRGENDANDVNVSNINFDQPVYSKPPEERTTPKPRPRKSPSPRSEDETSHSSDFSDKGNRNSTGSQSYQKQPNESISSYSNRAKYQTHDSPGRTAAAAKRPENETSSEDYKTKDNTNLTKESNKTASPSVAPSTAATSARQAQQDNAGRKEPSSNNEYESRATQGKTKAPKFTTTARRSSTVDEMLFDDYVAPTEVEDPVANIPPDSLPDNLMTFEPDPDADSPCSSSSEWDTNTEARGRSEGGGGKVRRDSDNSSDEVDNYAGGNAHDAEGWIGRSTSLGSDRSWSSNYSVESQPDEVTQECMEFMKIFVDKMFSPGEDISQTEKASFGRLCQHPPGRLWFSRYVNCQRNNSKKVDEPVFFRLMQYFAVCLFECNEADDFSPAKTLMTMCFTFYYEGSTPGGSPEKVFLYTYLRDQPIWQSLRFWNAAFFDAVQNERSRRPMPTSVDGKETVRDDRQFQANITFGQLGTFACNMKSFGLSKELCLEFLRKQSTIANLKKEQVRLLRENFERVNEKT